MDDGYKTVHCSDSEMIRIHCLFFIFQTVLLTVYLGEILHHRLYRYPKHSLQKQHNDSQYSEGATDIKSSIKNFTSSPGWRKLSPKR